MLLALGPLQLDTRGRTVVVGLPEGADQTSVAIAAAGADALWLRSPTAAQVAAATQHTGLAVGVTVADPGSLDDLVRAGAVAVECASTVAVDAALARHLALWCPPSQAVHAVAAGVPPERVVCEPGATGATTVPGVTVAGTGPPVWGEVVRAAMAGARVVRTSDVRSVRRVVTVVDRLVTVRDAATGRVV